MCPLGISMKNMHLLIENSIESLINDETLLTREQNNPLFGCRKVCGGILPCTHACSRTCGECCAATVGGLADLSSLVVKIKT